MRVLVCGGREYLDTRHIHATLDRVHAKHGITLIITGGARGADVRANAWAISKRIPYISDEITPEEWDAYGKGAGPMRNKRLLSHRPEACVAFPGGSGTRDMMNQAAKAGIPVWPVPPA